MSALIQKLGFGISALVIGVFISENAYAAPPKVIPILGTQAVDLNYNTLKISGLQTIPNNQLGEIRGGFEGNGVSVTFGFDIKTFINQNLVQTLSVAPVTIFTQLQNSSSQTVSDPALVDTSTQNSIIPKQITSTGSSGNTLTTISNSISPSGITELIQNQANNQLVQEIKTYNINVSGLQSELNGAASVDQLSHSLNPLVR